MDGFEFAAVDTLQHGLPGYAERFGGVLHDEPAVGDVVDEQGTQFVVEPDPPGSAGGELFAGDESVVEPAVQGGWRGAEFLGGVGDGEQLSLFGVLAGLVAVDVPVVAQALHAAGGERQVPCGAPALPVEDAGDGRVGVVPREPPDQADGVLVGSDRGRFAFDARSVR